ncbi:MAG: HD-GYP domain-containing protein [Lachnospiraceae bacterium]|nr:HD-GYP domain-containing protein [Lachnospiraceae bacterium]
MKIMSTKDLMPGMKTAEDVYTYNDQLILSKGVVLSDKAITRLEFYSILTIKVEDELVFNLAQQEMDSSYSERIKSSSSFKEFKKNFDKSVGHFQDLINDIVDKNSDIDTNQMLSNTLELLNTSEGSVNVFDMLHNMRQYDDSTYAHCLNVSLICNVFARWLQFSKDDTNLATLCGLLHDVGKIMIPDAIIKKPAKLTEQEFNIIKTHPLEGYQILKMQNINDHIKNAALMHHERCDGSGYPLGLVGNKIDKYAKIVSIADVYDAMTSARVYRGPLCPFKVIELFEAEGIQKYDTQFVLTFLECVVNTYLQNRVLLTNGVEGDIVFINKNALSKPVIKSGTNYIDLSTNPDLAIQALI